MFKLKQAVKLDEDGLVSRAAVADWWASAGPTVPSKQEAPPVLTRAAAGCIDSLCVMGAYFPIGVAAENLASAGVIGDVGVTMLTSCTLALGYTFRDSIPNGGTRSIGKSMAGLEIVKMNDGFPTDIVATRRDCLMRNSYGMLDIFRRGGNELANLDAIGPEVEFGCDVCGIAAHWMGIIDLGLILFSTQRRSIGDRLAKTMVVVEGPNHEARKARALRGA